MNNEYANSSCGLYIHIPFCQFKCPYCDFNSYATSKAGFDEKERVYAEALVLELITRSKELGLSGKRCNSIFFGGGTPSLLSPAILEDILNQANKIFLIDSTTEITIECNPRSIIETLSDQKLKRFRKAGINRVSIGGQSFNPSKLKFLGRWHSALDTINTFHRAREAGYSNINIDLIFGVKDETLKDWEEDLHNLVELSPEHISSYMLTMEPGTEFGKKSKKGENLIIDEEDFFEFYRQTQQILGASGYSQYEVSNFAKQGFECSHNLNYWLGGEYLAVGAGAHGFIKSSVRQGLRWSNTPSPEVYIKKVSQSGNAVQRTDPVGEEELIMEFVSFGLRLSEGINLADCNDFRVAKIKHLLEKGKFDQLIQAGHLLYSNQHLRVPLNHFNLVDGIATEICVEL